SIRKQFIHRKGIQGYSKDAIRAFADNMMKGSYQLARLAHMDELGDLMLQMQKKAKNGGNDAAHFYNEMIKRHRWVMNPTNSPISQKLTSIGFLYMLGASPAAAAVNVTQTWVIGLPVLGARFGVMATAKELV